MNTKTLLAGVPLFVLTFACGVFIASKLVPVDTVVDLPPPPRSVEGHSSREDGVGHGIRESDPVAPRKESRTGTNPLRILSKPPARYTDEARANNVQGSVRLKIVMLASGEVGQITVIQGLPDGLTDQAIVAARLLKFQPATKDGVPVSKTITIDYSFTIY